MAGVSSAYLVAHQLAGTNRVGSHLAEHGVQFSLNTNCHKNQYSMPQTFPCSTYAYLSDIPGQLPHPQGLKLHGVIWEFVFFRSGHCEKWGLLAQVLKGKCPSVDR